MIAAALAVFLCGVVIFVAPGAAVLAAARVQIALPQRLAWWFAASLSLLTADFALCVVGGASIAAALPVLGLVTVLGALAARRFVAADAETPYPEDADDEATDGGKSAPFYFDALLYALIAAAMLAAIVFAPVGSIDRWWYLAYVRDWAQGGVLTFDEPFLGTGQSFARFGLHPWLFGLAAWSHTSGVDVQTIYERAAPQLVVLASVSAGYALAGELFGRGLRSRLSVLATLLLWSGATIPLLARAGEDKVLAAAALLPLCGAALMRLVRSGGAVRGGRPSAALLLLAVAAVATAAVHALVYAFALVMLLPLAVLLAVRELAGRRTMAAGVVLLIVVAVAPAVEGVLVQQRLAMIGAGRSSPDHPVVRVHDARERIAELPFAGFVVSPVLLLHPIVLLALAALPLLLVRRLSTDSELADRRAVFLSAATALPLAIAFLPPLPLLAGTLIPPWMVYRVLWVMPLAPLAAMLADRIADRFVTEATWREGAATLLLLALGLPAFAAGANARVGEVRARLAAPEDGGFHELIAAIRALPAGTLVAAAPELSERLPALTGRQVVAGLDRSTIVFSGSRERGESRLRARAAVLAGSDDAGVLARAAAVTPTHAVFDPRSALTSPKCKALLFRSIAYGLCELDSDLGTGGRPVELAVVESDPAKKAVATGLCDAPAPGTRRSPWSAAAPIVDCRIELAPELRKRADLLLRIVAATGAAADELRVDLRTESGLSSHHATVRSTGRRPFVLLLPPLMSDAVDVRIASSFLPFVKPLAVEIVEK